MYKNLLIHQLHVLFTVYYMYVKTKISIPKKAHKVEYYKATIMAPLPTSLPNFLSNSLMPNWGYKTQGLHACFSFFLGQGHYFLHCLETQYGRMCHLPLHGRKWKQYVNSRQRQWINTWNGRIILSILPEQRQIFSKSCFLQNHHHLHYQHYFHTRIFHTKWPF